MAKGSTGECKRLSVLIEHAHRTLARANCPDLSDRNALRRSLTPHGLQLTGGHRGEDLMAARQPELGAALALVYSREGNHPAGRTAVHTRDLATPSEVRVTRMSQRGRRRPARWRYAGVPPDIAARFAPSWHRVESNEAPLVRATRSPRARQAALGRSQIRELLVRRLSASVTPPYPQAISAYDGRRLSTS
jgi:hypothetical protein